MFIYHKNQIKDEEDTTPYIQLYTYYSIYIYVFCSLTDQTDRHTPNALLNSNWLVYFFLSKSKQNKVDKVFFKIT